MLNLIEAMMGRKHCGWCVHKEPTWWERKMRFDIAMRTDSRPWHERAAMKLSDWSIAIGIWKLGARWHRKHHE